MLALEGASVGALAPVPGNTLRARTGVGGRPVVLIGPQGAYSAVLAFFSVLGAGGRLVVGRGADGGGIRVLPFANGTKVPINAIAVVGRGIGVVLPRDTGRSILALVSVLRTVILHDRYTGASALVVVFGGSGTRRSRIAGPWRMAPVPTEPVGTITVVRLDRLIEGRRDAKSTVLALATILRADRPIDTGLRVGFLGGLLGRFVELARVVVHTGGVASGTEGIGWALAVISIHGFAIDVLGGFDARPAVLALVPKVSAMAHVVAGSVALGANVSVRTAAEVQHRVRQDHAGSAVLAVFVLFGTDRFHGVQFKVIDII
jgi:hypothetical protein